MIDQGMGNRTTASTQMNAESSRSHSVFTFKLHQKDLEDESKNLFAKVNLVDLAGSEPPEDPLCFQSVYPALAIIGKGQHGPRIFRIHYQPLGRPKGLQGGLPIEQP